MEYKIIETEKGQREKVFKGNTMLYKKTKVEHDSEIIEYEMVVTYYEANIEFGVFRENEIVKDEELRKFLEDVFLLEALYKNKKILISELSFHGFDMSEERNQYFELWAAEKLSEDCEALKKFLSFMPLWEILIFSLIFVTFFYPFVNSFFSLSLI